ncbi:MAG: substrate-binding domain-containing protein, partial [Pirellulales bacterium]|nr:substrate-binding domain-containing protein [Pirellulales bacterium]
ASLEKDGLISRVAGKGTFIHEHARQRLHNSQYTFALIAPQTRSGIYPSLLHGFESGLNQRQYQTTICATENNLEKQGCFILRLLDMAVGGVAIVPTSDPPTPLYQIRQLQQRGTPVVFCHRKVEGANAPLVAIPFFEAGRIAGEAFLENGHRRVAIFLSQKGAAATGFENGLRSAMRAGGEELPAESVFTVPEAGLHHEEHDIAVRQYLQELFDRPEPPTAIMSSYDPLAELIYLELGQLDLQVGRDVSLIGFGSTWREGGLLRSLTSVVVDEAQTGRHAAELLCEMRFGNRPLDDNTEIMMPLSLTEGRTLGPAPN